MAQPHCFTLRLPREVYVELVEIAQAQGKTLNATVIDLIKIAMSQKMDVQEALQKMFNREFGTDAFTAKS